MIANAENPSIFLVEIAGQCLVLNQGGDPSEQRTEVSCPRCKTGRLVLRTNERDGLGFTDALTIHTAIILLTI